MPLACGGLTLREVDPGRITALSPWMGQADALSEALQTAHGMRFPVSGRATGGDGARVVWTGLDQAMLLGPEPDIALGQHCVMVDQSDAWAVVRLDGIGAEDVLARLVPVDLRPAVFKPGHTVRSLLAHMTVSVTRLGPETFQIMAFRSMAGTLVHDLHAAMSAVMRRSDG